MSDPQQQVVPKQPEDFSDDDISLGDDDIDIGGMEMDMGDILSEYLASEDGVTLGDSIFQISQAIQLQNKILIKMLNAQTKK
jgi:hypothetical protein